MPAKTLPAHIVYISPKARPVLRKRYKVRLWLSHSDSISGGYHATLEEAQEALERLKAQLSRQSSAADRFLLGRCQAGVRG